MTSARRNWSDDETAVALYLYLTLSFRGLTKTDARVLAAADYLGRTPDAVRFKASNLSSCDLGIRQKGFANVSRTDREVWARYMHDAPSLEPLLQAVDGFLAFERARNAPDETPLEAEALALVRRRDGQDLFRASTLTNFAGACALTGLTFSSLVEAAHILPWAECEAARLRPDNGLALNVLLHRAWDAELIGISPDGLVVSAADARERARLDDRDAVHGADLDFLNRVDGLRLRAARHVAPNRDFLDWRFAVFRARHL